MSKLINLDPHPIDWTKEDVILLTDHGVKRGPKTPSANAIIIAQSYYTGAISLCDAGNYLSIVTYNGKDGNGDFCRVGSFKCAVADNNGSCALLRPYRAHSPWGGRSTSPGKNPGVQLRIYKDGRVAILNREEVDGQTVWYVDTRRKAPFGALWPDDATLSGDEKIAKGLQCQPYLVRVTTDEEVEAAATKVKMKEANAFKWLLPNWLGDLSKKWMPRMTGTSWQAMSQESTKIVMNFFDVMNPANAAIRQQWRGHSGINLDSLQQPINDDRLPFWSPIDIVYWVACTGNNSAQKAAATRNAKFAALIAPFSAEIDALPDDTDLWGRTDDGHIMYASNNGYQKSVAFVSPQGKLTVGEQGIRSTSKSWTVVIPQIRALNVAASIRPSRASRIVQGQTIQKIFAGTVVEQLIRAKSPIRIAQRWNSAVEESTWTNAIREGAICELAITALAAESQPIVRMLREAGLMHWYSSALVAANNGELRTMFVENGKGSGYFYSVTWKYDPKATSFEAAVNYPKFLLQQIDAVQGTKGGQYACPVYLEGMFSKEEYAQLTETELAAVLQKLTETASGGYGVYRDFRTLRDDFPAFDQRRLIMTAKDPGKVRTVLMARNELGSVQWSPAWVLDGTAPVTFSMRDSSVKSQPVETIIDDISEWHKCYKYSEWKRCSAIIRDEAAGLTLEEPESLIALHKELDALRISGTSMLLKRMTDRETRTKVYRVRRINNPDTPYFLVAHDADGRNTVFGYLGCGASQSEQTRCMLQRRQMIYQNPADINAFLTKHAARL